MVESIKNLQNDKWVNIVLTEQDIEHDYFQIHRFLHSAASQQQVKVNIIGLKDDEAKKAFQVYLSFDQTVDGLKIYHSPRVVLAHEDIYQLILLDPTLNIVCSKLDKVYQNFWPRLPKDQAFLSQLEISDKTISTEKTNINNARYLPQCMYQT